MILADIGKAVEIEKKLGRGKSTLRDVLGRVVSDFNKMTTRKAHRIDSGRKSLIYNLLLTSVLVLSWGLGLWMFFVLPEVCGVILIFLFFLKFCGVIKYGRMRLRLPAEALDMIHRHYDHYKHDVSGL